MTIYIISVMALIIAFLIGTMAGDLLSKRKLEDVQAWLAMALVFLCGAITVIVFV